MGLYRHLLVAVELQDSGPPLLRRAAELAKQFGARLSALHVVEYLPVDPSGDALLAAPMDLSRERTEAARTRLRQWCEEAGLGADAATVSLGNPRVEIPRAAKDAGVDLIVVGHPPHRGLSALFGHTESGVVQKAECDVLALKL